MSLKKIPIITGFILLIVESISGQFQLIDDFNDGDSINTFGYPWRYYTESTYPIATGLGRPPAENKSIIDAIRFSVNGTEEKFASMPFTFGKEWVNASGWDCSPFVCLSALLAPTGSCADLSSSFGIRFKCRTHARELTFILMVETDDTKANNMQFNQIKISCQQTWREFSFYFDTLKPPFQLTNIKLSKNKITKITWYCAEMDNYGVTKDTFDLDDVYLIMTPVPLLTSPQNNTINAQQPVELKWTNIDSLQTTLVQLSTSQDFSSIAKAITVPGATTTITITDLTANTKYYWRARATNASGTSDWSLVRSFTTIPEIPIKVSLISPKKDSINTPVDITLAWQAISDASGYTLQVSQFDDFSAVDISKTDLTTAKAILSGLKNRTKYYWRVRAYNARGKGEWSETGNFMTIVSSPRILFPVNGAKNCDTTLSLNWTTVTYALSYDFQVSRTYNFFDTLISSTSKDTTFTLNHLLNGTKYYARVRTRDTNGYSLWSDSISFSTTITLPQKVLITPNSHSDTIKMDSVVIFWKKSTPEITHYQIDLSEDSTFTTARVDSTCIDTFIVFRFLKSGKSYWWRVKAGNIAGWGEYSDTQKLKVLIPVQVTVPATIKVTSFKAFFSGNELRYAIPEACTVHYSIYDVRGMLVNQAADKIVHSGVYVIKFPKLPSGTYYVVFNAGKYRYSGKITTVR
jgi:titin